MNLAKITWFWTLSLYFNAIPHVAKMNKTFLILPRSEFPFMIIFSSVWVCNKIKSISFSLCVCFTLPLLTYNKIWKWSYCAVTEFPRLIWLAEWVYFSSGKDPLTYMNTSTCKNEVWAIIEVQAAYYGCMEEETINLDWMAVGRMVL